MKFLFQYPLVFTPIKEGGLVPSVINLVAVLSSMAINLFIWYEVTKMLAHAVKLGLQ